MSSRLNVLLALVCLAISFAGCSFEPGERTQLAGQECFADNDCVEGLMCVQRRCRHRAYNRVDGADAGDTHDQTDVAPDDDTDVPPDVPGTIDVAVDGDQRCEPGTRRCAGERVVEVCVDDGTRFVRQPCEDGLVCTFGQCTSDQMCEDRDGDGFGPDCPRGPDCNDDDPAINRGAPEQCDTPVDDNCDGRVNENCTQCCPGGCGPNENCSNCQCVQTDPDVCTTQGQPCETEGLNNGYFCADLNENGDLRCLGLCERDADDPNSTCPDPGAICAFGDGQGVCLSGCTLSQGCGAPGFGCLPIDSEPREGMCVPTNPNNQVGDPCDADGFFDCETGAYCLDLQNGGRCVEGCRPYTHAFNDDTDCTTGHCVPLTNSLGMCRPDAGGQTEGESCRRQHSFRACNQDAVGCFPGGQGQGMQCTRICRLEEDDDDCPDGQTCFQYDQNRDDIGACVNGSITPIPG